MSKREKKNSESGLGGLLSGLAGLVDFVTQLSDAENHEISHSGEFRLPGGKAAGVYGVQIRTGIGGLPTVRSFGNIAMAPRGPVVEEVREPLTDVFEEADHMLVVAEVAGVREEDVAIEIHGDVLKFTASGPARQYAKELLLPEGTAATFRHSYTNGILEITIPRHTGDRQSTQDESKPESEAGGTRS